MVIIVYGGLVIVYIRFPFFLKSFIPLALSIVFTAISVIFFFDREYIHVSNKKNIFETVFTIHL